MSGLGEPVATYPYVDEQGVLIHEVRRYQPKTFRQRRPDGRGGYIWGLNGTRRVPYKLPAVRSAAIDKQTVVVCEGEHDADTLTTAGLVATTSCGGAAWKWTPDYAANFAGVPQIVIIADSDAPGRKAATERADILSHVCDDVRVLDLAPDRTDGFDASDWLGAGHTADELRERMNAAPRFDPGGYAKDEATVAGIPSTSKVTAHVTDWETTKLERIAWLMLNRLPCAEVTIIEGPGGVGKTTMALDIVARITTGRAMPDGTPGGEPAHVILIADEDRASILKARLVASGANLSRVHHIVSFGAPGDPGSRFSMPKHARALRDAVAEFGAALVVIDALFSHFDEGLKSGVTEDVRRVIGPLSEIAHSTGAVITATRHWGKTARGASQRGLGSVDITNVARSVITVAEDPDEPTRTVVAVAKGNLGIKHSLVPSLTFSMQSVTISEGGVDVDIARVAWGNQVTITADDLANAAPPSADDSSKTAECAELIRELLADGPRGAGEMEKALLAAGFKRPTYYRAKKKAGVVTIDPGGFPRKTSWSLPSRLTQSSHPPYTQTSETTETTGDDEPRARDRKNDDTSSFSETSEINSRLSHLTRSRIGGDDTTGETTVLNRSSTTARPRSAIPSPKISAQNAAACNFFVGPANGETCKRCGAHRTEHGP